MKRILVFCLCLLLVMGMTACASKETETEAVKLSFKSATSYAELKKLDGQTVAINGYMATSSPVDGGYLFLMNLPYQSCPFCSHSSEVKYSGRFFNVRVNAIFSFGKITGTSAFINATIILPERSCAESPIER